MAPLFAQLFDEEIPARFVFWDRSALGREDGPGTVVLRSARVLTRLVWSPDELGIARSFVAGDIDLDGRLFDLLETFYDGMRGARPGGGGRRTPAIRPSLVTVILAVDQRARAAEHDCWRAP